MDLADEYGVTPAYIAAQNGHTVALELLVKAVCVVNQASNNGASPPYILSLIPISLPPTPS